MQDMSVCLGAREVAHSSLKRPKKAPPPKKAGLLGWCCLCFPHFFEVRDRPTGYHLHHTTRWIKKQESRFDFFGTPGDISKTGGSQSPGGKAGIQNRVRDVSGVSRPRLDCRSRRKQGVRPGIYLSVMSMAWLKNMRCCLVSTLTRMYNPVTSFGTLTSVVQSVLPPEGVMGASAKCGLS